MADAPDAGIFEEAAGFQHQTISRGERLTQPSWEKRMTYLNGTCVDVCTQDPKSRDGIVATPPGFFRAQTKFVPAWERARTSVHPPEGGVNCSVLAFGTRSTQRFLFRLT